MRRVGRVRVPGQRAPALRSVGAGYRSESLILAWWRQDGGAEGSRLGRTDARSVAGAPRRVPTARYLVEPNEEAGFHSGESAYVHRG